MSFNQLISFKETFEYRGVIHERWRERFNRMQHIVPRDVSTSPSQTDESSARMRSLIEFCATIDGDRGITSVVRQYLRMQCRSEIPPHGFASYVDPRHVVHSVAHNHRTHQSTRGLFINLWQRAGKTPITVIILK